MQRPAAPSSLHRIAEVARRLNLRERTVWSLIAAGRIRVCRPRPRLVRIAEADVADFIALSREGR